MIDSKLTNIPRGTPLVEGAPVVRFGPNKSGRDIVAGDLHGSYELLKRGLRQIGFRRGHDRLFSVGDLIDRGPHSDRALIFLDWLNNGAGGAVRGNHEHMLIDLYRDGEPDPAAEQFMFSRNGMGWMTKQSADWRRAAAHAFAKMPIAIEIETQRGLVGLVHATVPLGMDWPGFTTALENGDPDLRAQITEEAVWSRERINQHNQDGVAGIDRVFVGHTPVDHSVRLGNIYHIDTGAVFGLLHDDPAHGRLTLADIMQTTVAFSRDTGAPGAIIDLTDQPEPGRPFGRYCSE